MYVCVLSLLCYNLPDTTASRVVIQCTGSVSPRDIASRLRYIADYTLQLYCTACFVELVTGCGTMLIDYFHLRHCTEINSFFLRKCCTSHVFRSKKKKIFVDFNKRQRKEKKNETVMLNTNLYKIVVNFEYVSYCDAAYR